MSISSYERDAPMSRGKIQLVPMSHAESPTLINATLNRAERAAIRVSEPSPQARSDARRSARVNIPGDPSRWVHAANSGPGPVKRHSSTAPTG